MRKPTTVLTFTIAALVIFSCTKSNRHLKVYRELDRCSLEPVYSNEQRSWGEYPHVEMAYQDSALSAIKYWVDDSIFFIERFQQTFNGYKHSTILLPDHKNIYYQAEKFYIGDTCVSIWRFGTNHDSTLHTTDRIEIEYGNSVVRFSFTPYGEEFGGVDEVFSFELPIKKFLAKNNICSKAVNTDVDRFKADDETITRTSYGYYDWLKSYAKRVEIFDRKVVKSINWLKYTWHTQKNAYISIGEPEKISTKYVRKRRKRYFPLITCDHH